jgi:hypothetical protein
MSDETFLPMTDNGPSGLGATIVIYYVVDSKVPKRTEGRYISVTEAGRVSRLEAYWHDGDDEVSAVVESREAVTE